MTRGKIRFSYLRLASPASTTIREGSTVFILGGWNYTIFKTLLLPLNKFSKICPPYPPYPPGPSGAPLDYHTVNEMEAPTGGKIF